MVGLIDLESLKSEKQQPTVSCSAFSSQHPLCCTVPLPLSMLSALFIVEYILCLKSRSLRSFSYTMRNYFKRICSFSNHHGRITMTVARCSDCISRFGLDWHLSIVRAHRLVIIPCGTAFSEAMNFWTIPWAAATDSYPVELFGGHVFLQAKNCNPKNILRIFIFIFVMNDCSF